jgi:hypothetical protein
MIARQDGAWRSLRRIQVRMKDGHIYGRHTRVRHTK